MNTKKTLNKSKEQVRAADNLQPALTASDHEIFFDRIDNHVSVSATDARGTIIYVNKRFAEDSQYAPEELIGQNHRILKSGLHDSKFYEDLWRTISGGKVWRGEIKDRAKDGSYYWIDTVIAPILGEDGKIKKYISIRFPVTKRKDIEEELHRKKEDTEFLASATTLLTSSLDYETILRHVADLIVPRFADWVLMDILNGNNILEHLAIAHKDPEKLKYAKELQKKYPAIDSPGLIHPRRVLRTGRSEFHPDLTGEWIKTAARDPELVKFLEELGLKSAMFVPIKHKDSIYGVMTLALAESDRHYSKSDLAVAEELGNRVGIAMENARLYRQLKDADQKKDDFIATLAHELRNPIAPLMLSSDILKEHVKSINLKDQTIDDTADLISRQVKTMARLLDDLLDISRLMRGRIILKKERVSMFDVCRQAVKTAQPHFDKQGVELIATLPTNPIQVYVDPIRVEQIIVNLLNNAAKFTPRGEKTWLEVDCDASNINIHVRDSGAGINPELLPKIFDVFVQDKERAQAQSGLGIGLAISKNFAVLHGGTLTAKSEGLGQGSEFILSLPVSNHMEIDPANLSLLIVDDNEDAAKSLATYLKYKGYANVKIATNGEQALTLGREMSPNYVLMDLRMPGMNGYETLHAMKVDPAYSKTIFIAVTGYGQEEDRKKTGEAGFDYHLVKPVDVQELIKILISPPR